MFLCALRAGVAQIGFLLFALMLCGCGGSQRPAIFLEGTVTLDGQPLPGGILAFSPVGGKGIVNAIIGQDGKYKTSLGATGTWNISVKGPTPPSDHTKKQVKVDLPVKYQDPKTSGLSCTVKEGENSFDVVLKK